MTGKNKAKNTIDSRTRLDLSMMVPFPLMVLFVNKGNDCLGNLKKRKAGTKKAAMQAQQTLHGGSLRMESARISSS
jgi:hypothetical protein